ncbi:MAG: hypothetical protein ACI4CA_02680, partial [Bacteroides sp.]
IYNIICKAGSLKNPHRSSLGEKITETVTTETLLKSCLKFSFLGANLDSLIPLYGLQELTFTGRETLVDAT